MIHSLTSVLRYLIISCGLLLAGYMGNAQQGMTWYFGEHAGLRFTTSEPVALRDSRMTSVEGCAVMHDQQGNLLFYTNGEIIWGRNHQPIHDTALAGSATATQGVLILPWPGSDDRYVVITCDAAGGAKGLRYSVLSFESGPDAGQLVRRDQPLAPQVSEKVTAIPMIDGLGFWIIAHELTGNAFLAYSFRKHGIDLTPVRSAVGADSDKDNYSGCLKASPDGRWLAAALRGQNTVELYRFDVNTGRIHSPIRLRGTFGRTYGIAFSADSRFLFFSNTEPGAVYMADLSLPDREIAISAKLMATSKSELIGALERGPDGRIYVARYQAEYLGVLIPGRFPRDWQYMDTAVYLGGRVSLFGLPNAYTPRPLAMQVVGRCSNDTLEARALTPTSSYDSIVWTLRHGLSKPQKATGPWLRLKLPGGNYVLSLAAYRGTQAERTSQAVEVFPSPTVEMPDSLWLCGDSGIEIRATPKEGKYRWSTGQGGARIRVFEPGIFQLTVTSNQGCETLLSTHIRQPPPLIWKLPTDTVVCPGETVAADLAELHGYRIRWNDDVLGSRRNLQPGQYTVVLKTACATDVRNIRIEEGRRPEPKFFPITACPGDTTLVQIIGDPSWAITAPQMVDSSRLLRVMGLDSVKVQITNQDGCSLDTIWQLKTPSHCPQRLVFPKELTPNGDGQADHFIPHGSRVTNYLLMVFNPSGDMVFSTTNQYKRWSGQSNDHALPAGRYTWIASYMDANGENQFDAGAVDLSW